MSHGLRRNGVTPARQADLMILTRSAIDQTKVGGCMQRNGYDALNVLAIHSRPNEGEMIDAGQEGVRQGPRGVHEEDRGAQRRRPPGERPEDRRGDADEPSAHPKTDGRDLRSLHGGLPLAGVVDTDVLIRGLSSRGHAGTIVQAIRDGVVQPVFSAQTWTEFDAVLERWRAARRISNRASADIRSALLEAGAHVLVTPSFTGCPDPRDDMLFDVLEQSEARWLCSDDRKVHAVDRDDVIGLGELVRLIEEVR